MPSAGLRLDRPSRPANLRPLRNRRAPLRPLEDGFIIEPDGTKVVRIRDDDEYTGLRVSAPATISWPTSWRFSTRFTPASCRTPPSGIRKCNRGLRSPDRGHTALFGTTHQSAISLAGRMHCLTIRTVTPASFSVTVPLSSYWSARNRNALRSVVLSFLLE